MTLKYVGIRAFRERLAEFGYSEEEEEHFMKIADYLREAGWNIDTGCENWAAIKITNKEEFNHVMEDFKKAKKCLNNAE